MGAGDLSWSLERNSVVDLTHTVFPETVTFIYRAPAFYSRAWILFQDIDFRIWISLSLVMISGSLVYCMSLCLEIIFKTESTQRLDKNKIFVKSATQSVSSFYKALLGQTVTCMPKTIIARSILGVWMLGSLILTALYGGSLTSRLSLHKSPSPVDNLQLLMKRHPSAILAVGNNSQIHFYFKESESRRKLWLENIKKNIIPGKYHIDDTMKRVHDQEKGMPIYVWIAERSMLMKQMHRYSDDSVICDLYVAKDDIVTSDWSIALVRNSPFLKQFNEKIIKMQRYGLFLKWYRKHWESVKGGCRPTDGLNPTERSSISLTDVQSIFFVLMLGWCVSSILLLAEKLAHHWQKKMKH